MAGNQGILGAGVAWILGPQEIPVGVGILVGARELVTCAHVANVAVGRNPRHQACPEGPIRVGFPFLAASGSPTPSRAARVASWTPPAAAGVTGDDVAGLVITDPGGAPQEAVPSRLLLNPPVPGQEVHIFGCPPERPRGVWTVAIVRGVVGDGRLQLDADPTAAWPVRPGFSGSPVWEPVTGRLAGIVVATAAGMGRDSYAILAGQLRLAWPEVLDPCCRATGHAGKGTCRGKLIERTRRTVLHISEPRLAAAKPIAEGSGHQASAPVREALFEHLHDDLEALAEQHDVRPDTIVVTGGLSQHGRRTEFSVANEFLGALAEAVEIPKSRVAIVPGSTDVNRRACAAYFAEQEADEREPTAPYWPKWKHFSEAFERFYSGTVPATYTPDEPWSLFEMPELSVVIAGLNSTLAETHQKRDRHGWLGPEQLSWFVENLSRYRDRGWIRLAALHHSVHESVPSQDRLQDVAALDRALGAGGLVDLVLHGRPVAGAPCRLPSGLLALGTGHTGPKTASCAGFHVPDQFQLLVIESGTVTRYARHYDAGQRRWIGDTRISPTGSDWYERFAFSERHSRFLGSGHGTVTGEVTAARSEPSVNLSVPDTTDRTALSRRSGSSGPVRMSTERAYGPGSESIANTATAPVRRSDDEELVHRVLEATLARLPEATVTVAGPPEARYLRVSAPLPGRSGADQWPVGVVAEPTVEAVSGFVRHVHARFWAADPSVPSELVHAGPPASAGLMERARLAGVRLRSFVDYQGLLDLRPLIERQAGQLFGDRVYPAALYVPQRYRSVDGEVAEGLLQRVTGWLGHDTARFVMVLGDFGRGKTVLLRQLARTLPTELPGVLPVLVELRSLEKAPSLDELLGQHLIRNGVEDVNPRKLQYMIRSGRLALLFDGFDELELRVGYDNAADYLQVLLRSVTDRAKVVLTSRTQHFRSTEQVRTALGDRVAGLGASRVVILEDFSRHQILRFLTNRYGGDEEAAIRRYRLLGEVEDLLGLSRNPRMLDFVAALDEHRLRDIQAQHGRISAAELYRELVDFWLVGEAGRQRHRQGMPSLDECERLDACTALALRLWSAPADRIPTAEFSAQVSTTLTRLVERGYTTEQAAHAIGSGSLLVRTEDDAFTFVHQSIVEWLVAHVVARELRAHRSSTPLTTRRMTKLMVDFLIDLVGVPLAQDWARQTLMSSCCSQRAKQNALQVTTRIPAVLAEKPRGATASDVQDQERVDLRGIDLRGQDLTGLDLSSAVLSGADLRGMRLERVNLTEADLTHARFEGATLAGGTIRRAQLQGSTWRGAALLGVNGLDVPGSGTQDSLALQDTPELCTAAVSGRDKVLVVIAPGGSPLGADFSPDGTVLALGCGRVAVLVDVNDGNTFRVCHGHSNAVLEVAFSPDGALLATASADGTARVWNPTTGEHLRTLTGHSGRILEVAFSPDGALLATASADGTARVWSTVSWSLRTVLSGHNGPVRTVAFSSRSLLATGADDALVRLWGADGEVRAVLAGHGAAVRSVVFSPDGELLATGSDDTTVRLWETVSGAARATLTGHAGPVRSVAFSPDGALLATASHDTTARVWRVATGRTHATLSGHTDWVLDAVFAPDGTILTTISDDGSTRLWNVATGRVQLTLTRHTDRILGVTFSPHGALLATASGDGTARLWKVLTGQAYKTITGHSDRVHAVAFSPDGALLATASDDATIRVHEVATGATVATLVGHENWVNAVEFSPSGSLLASASSDGTLRTWDPGTGKTRATFTVAGEALLGLAFSPEGRLLAAAVGDATARIWTVDDGNPEITISGHTDRVHAVAFSPDGSLLATGSDDGTARLWDLGSASYRCVLSGHTDWVNAVAFSPDGSLLATGSDDGTARLWDLTGEKPPTILSGHTDRVLGVAFSPDGSLLASASDDGTTRLWNSHAGTLLATLLALPDNGYAALFPDGSYKLRGDPGQALWWAVKVRRFPPGELDQYVDGVHRLPETLPIISPVRPVEGPE